MRAMRPPRLRLEPPGGAPVTVPLADALVADVRAPAGQPSGDRDEFHVLLQRGDERVDVTRVNRGERVPHQLHIRSHARPVSPLLATLAAGTPARRPARHLAALERRAAARAVPAPDSARAGEPARVPPDPAPAVAGRHGFPPF